MTDKNSIPDCFLLFNEANGGKIWLNRLAIACFVQESDGTMSFVLSAPAPDHKDTGLEIHVSESWESVKGMLHDRFPESPLRVASPYPSWTETSEFTLVQDNPVHVNPLAVACLRSLENDPFLLRTEIRFIHAIAPRKIVQTADEVADALNKLMRGMFVPAES